MNPSTPPPPRALWLWDPVPFLSDRDARAGFFDFCRRHRIGILWAQIATRLDPSPRHLVRVDDWKRFLVEAHSRQIKVHALDGDPHHARRTEHALPLSIVDAVVAYNASAAAGERFDGMHFDIEPQALLEWKDPVRRERLLADYLALNEQAAIKVKRAGLEYGVDIPVWWGARDEETGEPIGMTMFRGVRAVASDRVFGMVDNVAIMDYRNRAHGPDGIIARARELLGTAERISNARVYIGVETSVERGEYWFVPGIPRPAMRAALASQTAVAVLLDHRRASIADDGPMMHVGVKASADAADVLAQVTRAFNLRAAPHDAALAASSAIAALRREGEWLDIEPRTVTASDGSTFAALAATYATPSKITFAGRSLPEMEGELAPAENDLAAYRAYAGIAIHDYASYRRIADAAR
jgi:hypothetical protein